MKILIYTTAMIFVMACGVSATMATLPTPVPSLTNQAPIDGKASNTPAPIFGKVIATQTLNLRELPSETAAKDDKGLQAGDIVVMKYYSGGWWYVITDDGRTGWVKAKFIEVIP